MKILLGGVPFGRNNIGDEAILACVVKIVREAAPGAELTVSTDDPATAGRLGVNVCPLFGFDVIPYSEEEMRAVMGRHDVYIWSGATGLSDYPDRACELLAAARQAHCRRIVWNVGMNTELNPAKYKLRGKRLAVAALADRVSAGLFSVQSRLEDKMEAAARAGLKQELMDCRLVVTRDPESAREVARCGLPASRVVVGADSALIQDATPWPLESLNPADILRLEKPGIRRVALCVSAQREITRWPELVSTLDRILELPNVELVGLPMNPITDLEILLRLQKAVKNPEAFHVIAGVTEPADITALAARMDVIISSRLHLLILGSIHHVPLIGISRGSKVDNFLEPFGVKAVGSVESCDFGALVRETNRLLNEGQAFRELSQTVRAGLLERLDRARALLRAELAS
ncbi:MAG: polysaccharide pyruvyl transferase family protein [Terrimicrobiaceae bacterium]